MKVGNNIGKKAIVIYSEGQDDDALNASRSELQMKAEANVPF